MRDYPPKPVHIYNRAVFLDRYGTINVDTHYPYDASLLEIIPRSLDGIKILSRLPVHIIVVSNQAGIALGIFTRKDMSNFNKELRSRVERASGRIDAFYYCPHLEPKNLTKGQMPCNCSKPAPGLLLEAARDFNIDLSKSFIIGDKTSDIVAGEVVGCTGILVKTGKGGKEEGALPIKTNIIVDDLYEASLVVQSLIEHEELEKVHAVVGS
ncbi:TPA: HAD family hydrolase [Candidatus Poribacteria bacterium]|nr:HAD family hydrolase [Candidatus Poribacteria bacterium]